MEENVIGMPDSFFERLNKKNGFADDTTAAPVDSGTTPVATDKTIPSGMPDSFFEKLNSQQHYADTNNWAENYKRYIPQAEENPSAWDNIKNNFFAIKDASEASMYGGLELMSRQGEKSGNANFANFIKAAGMYYGADPNWLVKNMQENEAQSQEELKRVWLDPKMGQFNATDMFADPKSFFQTQLPQMLGGSATLMAAGMGIAKGAQTGVMALGAAGAPFTFGGSAVAAGFIGGAVASAISRPIESLMEGYGAFDEAYSELAKKYPNATHQQLTDMAMPVFNKTFDENMQLQVLDAVQLGLSIIPVTAWGKGALSGTGAIGRMARRADMMRQRYNVAAHIGETAFQMGTEGWEEGRQMQITNEAINKYVGTDKPTSWYDMLNTKEGQSAVSGGAFMGGMMEAPGMLKLAYNKLTGVGDDIKTKPYEDIKQKQTALFYGNIAKSVNEGTTNEMMQAINKFGRSGVLATVETDDADSRNKSSIAEAKRLGDEVAEQVGVFSRMKEQYPDVSEKGLVRMFQNNALIRNNANALKTLSEDNVTDAPIIQRINAQNEALNKENNDIIAGKDVWETPSHEDPFADPEKDKEADIPFDSVEEVEAARLKEIEALQQIPTDGMTDEQMYQRAESLAEINSRYEDLKNRLTEKINDAKGHYENQRVLTEMLQNNIPVEGTIQKAYGMHYDFVTQDGKTVRFYNQATHDVVDDNDFNGSAFLVLRKAEQGLDGTYKDEKGNYLFRSVLGDKDHAERIEVHTTDKDGNDKYLGNVAVSNAEDYNIARDRAKAARMEKLEGEDGEGEGFSVSDEQLSGVKTTSNEQAAEAQSYGFRNAYHALNSVNKYFDADYTDYANIPKEDLALVGRIKQEEAASATTTTPPPDSPPDSPPPSEPDTPPAPPTPPPTPPPAPKSPSPANAPSGTTSSTDSGNAGYERTERSFDKVNVGDNITHNGKQGKVFAKVRPKGTLSQPVVLAKDAEGVVFRVSESEYKGTERGESDNVLKTNGKLVSYRNDIGRIVIDEENNVIFEGNKSSVELGKTTDEEFAAKSIGDIGIYYVNENSLNQAILVDNTVYVKGEQQELVRINYDKNGNVVSYTYKNSKGHERTNRNSETALDIAIQKNNQEFDKSRKGASDEVKQRDEEHISGVVKAEYGDSIGYILETMPDEVYDTFDLMEVGVTRIEKDAVQDMVLRTLDALDNVKKKIADSGATKKEKGNALSMIEKFEKDLNKYYGKLDKQSKVSAKNTAEAITRENNKGDGTVQTAEQKTEAYHADKAAGKETELTKAVEELLGKPTEKPKTETTPTVSSEVVSGSALKDVGRTAKAVSKRVAVEHAGYEGAKRVTGANENTLELDGYGTVSTSQFINTLVENGRLPKDALKNRHIQLTDEYATKLLNENSDLFPKENTETNKTEANLPTFESTKKEYDNVKEKHNKYLKKDGGLRANTPDNVKKEIDDAYTKMQSMVKQERDKRVSEDKRDTGLIDGIERIKDNTSAFTLVRMAMNRGVIPERQFNEFGKNLLHIIADAKDSHEVTMQTAEIIQDFSQRANVKVDDLLAREIQAAENLKYEPVEEVKAPTQYTEAATPKDDSAIQSGGEQKLPDQKEVPIEQKQEVSDDKLSRLPKNQPKSTWQQEQDAIDSDAALTNEQKQEKKVEVTAKALEGADKIEINKKQAILNAEKIDKGSGSHVKKMSLGELNELARDMISNEKYYQDKLQDAQGVYNLAVERIQELSESYHKAKADGSNPELVKAVEDLIAPKVAPTTNTEGETQTTEAQLQEFGVPEQDVKPVTNVLTAMVDGLRKAGLTAAKTVGEWLQIGKGEEKPYTLKINGEEKTVKPVNAEVVNGFYSPLEKIITESKFDKLPAKQWLDKFAKGEEAKWTGLQEWLSQQQGSVSKADIQKFLKENRIQVVEVVKGEDLPNYYLDKEPPSELGATRVDLLGDLSRAGNLDNPRFRDYLNNKYGRKGNKIYDWLVENSKVQGKYSKDTKFSEYQLEGDKENYKEVLVTMPVAKSKQEYVVEQDYRTPDTFYAVNQKTGVKLKFGSYELAKSQAERLSKESQPDFDKQFKSSHFDEPNILVHLRMNTRTDAEGNKVLFLEEVQSDWGQKGKKEGFKGEELDPANLTFKVTPEGTFNLYQLYDKNGNLVFELPASKSKGDNVFTKESLRQEFKGSQAIELMGKTTPTAPFVTDTNAWTKLGLKVALKEAVKQGVDKIAWTTGEQQNERYDLSKQVEYIQYEDGFGGTKYVDISTQNSIITLQVDKDGKVLENKNTQLPDIVGKNLSDVIGKDATEKIMRGDGAKERIEPLVVKDDITGKYDVIINGRSVSSGHETYNEARADYLKNPKYQSTRRLQGDGLKVGGKGMKGFYGSPTENKLGIVGNVAKSLFKQEPKTVDIDLSPAFAKKQFVVEYSENEPMGNKWLVKDENGGVVARSTSESGANLLKETFEDRKKQVQNTSTQHSIDITPELKASVEGGQPLFKDAEAQYRIESGKNIIEAIKDFDGSPRATVALTHEIMHPTVVAIIDGAKEGNEVGKKHTETIVSEFNKANPKNKVTVEDLIKSNDAFKDGTTSKQYRQVQEFIAKSWEQYHTEGGKGFSEAFQKVLDRITKVFQSVYKSLTGEQLTPELRKMFDDILGKEELSTDETTPTKEVSTPENKKVEGNSALRDVESIPLEVKVDLASIIKTRLREEGVSQEERNKLTGTRENPIITSATKADYESLLKSYKESKQKQLADFEEGGKEEGRFIPEKGIFISSDVSFYDNKIKAVEDVLGTPTTNNIPIQEEGEGKGEVLVDTNKLILESRDFEKRKSEAINKYGNPKNRDEEKQASKEINKVAKERRERDKKLYENNKGDDKYDEVHDAILDDGKGMPDGYSATVIDSYYEPILSRNHTITEVINPNGEKYYIDVNTDRRRNIGETYGKSESTPTTQEQGTADNTGTFSGESNSIKYQIEEFRDEPLSSVNPALAEHIRQRMQRLFPSVALFGDKASFEAAAKKVSKGVTFSSAYIGAAIKNMVYVDAEKALQHTEIHEYAHIYWDALPADHPLKTALLDKFGGNEEAAIDAIGRAGTIIMENELDIAKSGFFEKWLKKFWAAVKGVFTSKSIEQAFAERLLTNADEVTEENITSGVVKYMKMKSSAKYSELSEKAVKGIEKIIGKKISSLTFPEYYKHISTEIKPNDFKQWKMLSPQKFLEKMYGIVSPVSTLSPSNKAVFMKQYREYLDDYNWAENNVWTRFASGSMTLTVKEIEDLYMEAYKRKSYGTKDAVNFLADLYSKAVMYKNMQQEIKGDTFNKPFAKMSFDMMSGHEITDLSGSEFVSGKYSLLSPDRVKETILQGREKLYREVQRNATIKEDALKNDFDAIWKKVKDLKSDLHKIVDKTGKYFIDRNSSAYKALRGGTAADRALADLLDMHYKYESAYGGLSMEKGKYRVPVARMDFGGLAKKFGFKEGMRRYFAKPSKYDNVIIDVRSLGLSKPLMTLKQARQEMVKGSNAIYPFQMLKLTKKVDALTKEAYKQFNSGRHANGDIVTTEDLSGSRYGVSFVKDDESSEDLKVSMMLYHYANIENESYDLLSPYSMYIQKYLGRKDKPNMLKWVKMLDDDLIKGESPTSNLGVYAKYVQALTNYTHWLQLGFNIAGMPFNAFAGFAQSVREIGFRNTLRGLRRVIGSLTVGGGAGVVNAKAISIMEKLHIVSLSKDLEMSVTSKIGKGISKIAFLPVSFVEYINHAYSFIGAMDESEWERVKALPANASAEDYTKAMGGNERVDELHTLTQKINGAYSKYSRRGINKTAEGRALMQFKNWLPDVIFAHLTVSQLNEAGEDLYGEYQSGIATSIKNTVWNKTIIPMFKDKSIAQAKKNWETLSEHEQMQVGKAMRQLVILGGMALWIASLDDRDDKELKRMLKRAMGDVTYIFDVSNMQFLFDNTVPVFGTIKNLLGLVAEVFSTATGNPSVYEKRQGSHMRGDLKLPVMIENQTPVVNKISKLVNEGD